MTDHQTVRLVCCCLPLGMYAHCAAMRSDLPMKGPLKTTAALQPIA